MDQESFSPQQSINLIQSMIQKTKNAAADSSVFFLLWGWVIFVACVLQYFLKNVLLYQHHYYAWFIIIIGIVGSAYFGSKQDKEAVVKTYISESVEHLWLGIGITFLPWFLSLPKLVMSIAFLFTSFYMLLAVSLLAGL